MLDLQPPFLRSTRAPPKIRALYGLEKIAVFSLALTSVAAAPPPKVAALSPQITGEVAAGFGGAVERVLRAQLDDLHVASSAVTPPLSLSELQLAVGCVGETPACMKAVAGQLEVDQILHTVIDRTGTELVLSVSLYDGRSTADPRRSVSRKSGPQAETELLDGIDRMLRELYGLPPPPKKEIPLATTKVPVVQEKPLPIVPIIVAGAGAALLITGGIFGSMAKSKEDDYAAAPTGTREEVNAAISLRESAEGKATAANVFFVLGGIGIATGAALYFIAPFHDTPEVALMPWAGEDGGGLVIGGTFGGGR